MEVNGEAGRDFVYGIYIDNPSETVLDMGYYHSDSYRFGILLWQMRDLRQIIRKVVYRGGLLWKCRSYGAWHYRTLSESEP